MNKYQKENILTTLASVEKANEVLKEYIILNQTSKMQTLLIECQNVAIEIGTFIEKIEGADCEVVHLLEQYCEMIYLMSIKEKSEQLAYWETIKKHLVKVKNWVRREIVSKLEVVFLPYKVEMWDSMESVWRAAMRDGCCDCHVVPIPYYVRDTKAGGEQFCYEGELFPLELNVEKYTEYLLEERHPDIIIIHNPYDDNNLVTSVHPHFYSTELKKYTGMLVYIPYFVSLHGVQKHYCTLPGVLMADLVVVQSEIVRDIYIEEYDRVLKENDLEKYMIAGKEKFVALGSPKFDKVRMMNGQEVSVPDDWAEMLKSTYKKVVLYNTHLSGVMKTNSEKFFEQLKKEFATFRENEDIVLIWRPHPLTESTIRAMNPTIAAQYEEIVRNYRSQKWGIYDDTPDMYRAIVLSDAYYGDSSSLVPLYLLTGKPIMVRNIKTNLDFKNIKKEYCISDEMSCGLRIWNYILNKI